jgi:hypothetical protein
MRFFPQKTIEQQDLQCMHQVRSRLVGCRTQLTNQIRSLLSEYGIEISQHLNQVRKALAQLTEESDERLSAEAKSLFRELYDELCTLEWRIEALFGITQTWAQPHFADTDLATLGDQGLGWQLIPNFTPTLDVTYSNGVHDGQAYTEVLVNQYGLIGGSDVVRENFTVTDGGKGVTGAAVRLGYQSGTADLIVTLADTSGSPIAQAPINYSAVVSTTPGSGDVNGNWVVVTTSSPTTITLTNGATYNLLLSTASGTQYSMTPIRNGSDVGFSSYAFSEGTGQYSTDGGSTWNDLYPYSPENMQFYLITTD